MSYRTAYNTKAVKVIARNIAICFLKITGWKTIGQRPKFKKYVVVAAPHTSNLDFIYTICLCLVYNINPVMLMKKSWFIWPLSLIFQWLGAIPIDRSRSNNTVAEISAKFQKRKNLVIVIPPSGTRKKVTRWKTGFYYISKKSNVPVVLGFLDYKRKIGGIGPTIIPSKDVSADMKKINNFYKNVTGKNPNYEFMHTSNNQLKSLTVKQ